MGLSLGLKDPNNNMLVVVAAESTLYSKMS